MPILLALVLLPGCHSDEEAGGPTTGERLSRLQVPIDLTVKQRTTTVVPSSDKHLSLTVDDITRNQVMVSLATDTGETILSTRSMSPKDHVAFAFAGREYELVLRELDNALIGEDTAKISIIPPSGEEVSEREKIDRLIDAVAELKDVTFIRNGSEHTATEAADHLRTKWEAAGDEVATARQFIDNIASKSSLTGEAYQIRFADGKTISASDFLNQRLAEVSKQ